MDARYSCFICGRYTHLLTWRQLRALYGLSEVPTAEFEARFNIAPTQQAPVIREETKGVRRGALLRWGLVPAWSKDPGDGPPLFNARAETLASKPAFRGAFKSRRCIVPCSGFYEWRKDAQAKVKQPFWIGRQDRGCFAFAGLWERWNKGPEPLESFTIITTAPNALLAPLHDRMPVILAPADIDRWLDPGVTDAALLTPLLRTPSEEGFEVYPVSSRVNSPRVDGPDLVNRVEEDRPTLF